MSMQSMLKSCDYATTTTNCLKNELENYCPKVYINRNVASEEMILLSEQALKNKPDNKRWLRWDISVEVSHIMQMWSCSCR